MGSWCQEIRRGNVEVDRLSCLLDGAGRQLLATWPNVMDGAISLDDVTASGRTHREVIEEAEAMRLDDATPRELRLHIGRLGRLR